MIYWDLGNVLFKFYNDDFKMLLESLTISSDKKRSFSVRYDDILSDSFIGKIDYFQTIERISEVTGLNSAKILELTKDYKIEINHQLLDFIKKDDLHSHGIISDLHQIAYRALIDKFPNFFDYFTSSHIFLSFRTRMTKRDGGLKYFSKIFSKNSKKTIYVDDDEANLCIVKRTGAAAVLFPWRDSGRSWSEANKFVFQGISFVDSKKEKK